MSDIFFWTRHDEYGFCSNFWRASVLIDDEIWPTNEHYYQAMKTFDEKERTMILQCVSPKEAKFAGYHVKLRSDWDEIKNGVMLKALRAKFKQHDDLKRGLLKTGESILHENSPWDMYWGYKGKDMLGKLLMQVREELRND